MKKQAKRFLSVFLAMMMLLSAIPSVNVFAANIVYETENNNTYATANAVKTGDIAIGNLLNGDDVDFYKFVAPGNGNLTVTFGHTYADSDKSWNIDIYRFDDGEYYWVSGTTVKLNGNEKVTVPFVGAEKGGIYYIKVANSVYYYEDVVGVNYKLNIGFEVSDYYEKEKNNIYADATNVAVNNAYGGVLNNRDDVDIYKVVAPSNGKLTVAFCHTYTDSDKSWNIDIYRFDDGEYYWVSGTTVKLNGNEKVTVPFVGAEKGGIYYIKVANSVYYYEDVVGVNYKLNIGFEVSDYYEKEKNNIYADATNIAVNNAYGGVLNNRDDVDIYKVVAPSNGKLTVTFGHAYADNNTNWYADIYKYKDGEYLKISEKSISLSDKKDSVIYSAGITKNEIYYIKIGNSVYYESGLVGKEYKLKVNFSIDPILTVKATAGATSVKLAWSKVNGASGYQIQQYKNGKWVLLGSTKSTAYTVQNLSKSTICKFRIIAYVTVYGKTYYSPWKYVSVATEPATAALKASAGANKVTLSWKKVSGASGYVIYRATSKNGTYKKIATITSGNNTKYTNSSLKAGKTYYYKIKAYISVGGNNTYSAYSSAASAAVKPAAPSIKATSGKKEVKLNWKKVAGADGYVIYRSTSKNGKYKKVATTKSSTTKYTDKKLSSKKNYYYKVNAYVKTSNGKTVYSSYSKVKSVKTK